MKDRECEWRININYRKETTVTPTVEGSTSLRMHCIILHPVLQVSEPEEPGRALSPAIIDYYTLCG